MSTGAGVKQMSDALRSSGFSGFTDVRQALIERGIAGLYDSRVAPAELRGIAEKLRSTVAVDRGLTNIAIDAAITATGAGGALALGGKLLGRALYQTGMGRNVGRNGKKWGQSAITASTAPSPYRR